MKTIFTLITILAAFVQSNAQAILNEVYAFPGGSRNEFFEFYNNDISSVSMDNYTLVTYYETATTKGFFVLDLPNLSVAPRGYFVGSSAIPFNYQGVTNSTMSNFSWNDLAFMAANGGYLRQWQLGTTVPAGIDGNANYDMVAIPPNFNNIFQKVGGTGATYNVFVYNNGMLQDVFLGGTGGATFVPNYIVGLPKLHVDMSGSSPDFDIDFSTYGTVQPEYVTQDIGSDNGYIRLVDGYCGTWTKSSAQITHTPGVTNGGDPSTITPAVSVSSVVVRGTASTGSVVNYDVVSASPIDFPITLRVFVDNGTVPGQLDAGDTYVESKVENTVTDGPFSTTFFPYTANVLIQTLTSAGCIDALRFIPNVGVLPVRFTGFQATASSTDQTVLKWYVADNETGKQFEVERSTDGQNFSSIAVVLSTEKTGSEVYDFKAPASNAKMFYRIKLVDKSNKISYSNTLAVGNTIKTSGNLSLNQNPVDSYLVFGFKSPESSAATINIYNASGALVYSQKTNLTKDANTVAVNLDGKVFTGLYVLEVKTPFDHNSVKFIKR
ncbi:MAG: T9SS type A sorting domain-containing protein [Flavisolibacter sp.]